MTDTIIMQGPGYTIAQTDVAGTAVPYGPFGASLIAARITASWICGITLSEPRRYRKHRAAAVCRRFLQAVLTLPAFALCLSAAKRALFPLANAKPGEPTWLLWELHPGSLSG